MKIKTMILLPLALCIAMVAAGQQGKEKQDKGKDKEKKEKITFKKTKVVQDTILSTYPLLTSVEDPVILGKAVTQKTIAGRDVSVFPVEGKGVVYIRVTPLQKKNRPILEFLNSGGSVIASIPVRNEISTINLEHVPRGVYTVTVDFDEERYSWEITKE